MQSFPKTSFLNIKKLLWPRYNVIISNWILDVHFFRNSSLILPKVDFLTQSVERPHLYNIIYYATHGLRYSLIMKKPRFCPFFAYSGGILNSPGTFVHFRDTLSFSMRKSTFLYIRLKGPGTARCKI